MKDYFILLITYKIQEIPKTFAVFRCDSSVDYPELPVYVSAPNVPPRGVDFASWIKDRGRCFGQLAEYHEKGEGYFRFSRMRAAESYSGKVLTEARTLEWMKQNQPKEKELLLVHERQTAWLEIMQFDDPESFYASQSHDWEDWAKNLRQAAILTSPNPSIWQKIKVYELISRIVKTCEANYEVKKGKNPHTVIAIDEAHVFAPRQKTLSTVSEAANLFRRTRSCGIHVLLTSHSPILMDQMLLSNLSMVVNVGVTSESDNRLLADVMALDHRQIEQMKSIRVEQAIVKCGALPPQLVTVPNQNCSSTHPRDLIAPTLAGMKRLEIHPVIEWPAGDKPQVAPVTPKSKNDFIMKNAMQALKVMADGQINGNPLSHTRRYVLRELKIREREEAEVRKWLIENNYVREYRFQTEKKGSEIFYNFTPRAVDTLKNSFGYKGLRENVDTETDVHWSIKQASRLYFEDDCCVVRREAIIETDVPGRNFRADFIVEYPSGKGERVIGEILLSNEPEDVVGLISGLRQQLSRNFDYLMLVTETQAVADRIMRHIRENAPELKELVDRQVQFRQAYEFFGNKPDNKQASRKKRA